MNTHALRKLREKLADGRAVFGLWVTLEAASVTEMAVALGLDWVVIDAEHGHLDWKEVVEHSAPPCGARPSPWSAWPPWTGA